MAEHNQAFEGRCVLVARPPTRTARARSARTPRPPDAPCATAGWQSERVHRWHGLDAVPAGRPVRRHDRQLRRRAPRPPAVLAALVAERPARGDARSSRSRSTRTRWQCCSPTARRSRDHRRRAPAGRCSRPPASTPPWSCRSPASWPADAAASSSSEVLVDALRRGARSSSARTSGSGTRNSGDVGDPARARRGARRSRSTCSTDVGPARRADGRRWSSTVGPRAARRGRRRGRRRRARPPAPGRRRRSCTATSAGASSASRPPTSRPDSEGRGPGRRRLRRLAGALDLAEAAADRGCRPRSRVGTNPTFDGVERRVEAYVLDRDDLELYGERSRSSSSLRSRPR